MGWNFFLLEFLFNGVEFVQNGEMDGIVLLVGFFNICFKGAELKMWLGLAVF